MSIPHPFVSQPPPQKKLDFLSDESTEPFPVRWHGTDSFNSGFTTMAKPTTVKIKLASTADTGFFYVTKKNPRTQTEKLSFKKYDPVVRKHVEFKETKIK